MSPSNDEAFFADSDGEPSVTESKLGRSGTDADVQMMTLSSSPQSLFLPGDDDEDAISAPERLHTPDLGGYSPAPEADSDMEMASNIPGIPNRSSSVASASSGSIPILSRDRSPEPLLRPSKRRRVSPSLDNQLTSHTAAQSNPPFQRAYLGSFLVGNAWSTVRGRGYIKPGETVLIDRDDQTSSTRGSNAKSKKGKEDVKVAGKGKGKQQNIQSMFKAQSKTSSKAQKPDTVVRLTNKSGFEFGRLPKDVSTWASQLLDMGTSRLQSDPYMLTRDQGLWTSKEVH